MNFHENLYYGLGELAYAVAKADGQVQRSEEKKIQQIVEDGCKNHNPDVNVTEVIFKILENDNKDFETSYSWAMDSIKLSSHLLTPEVKSDFIRIIEEVALAFGNVHVNEQSVIDRFKKDIETL